MEIIREKLPYRKGVGVILLNPKKEVFVGRRIDEIVEAWQMPQGGIDEGEKPEIAAFRELLEETGVEKAHIIKESSDWHYYDLPDSLLPITWGGKYRGQQQKWYVMEFLGIDDKDINIHSKHAEFKEWKWVSHDLLPEIIVPFKKELYQKLVNEFRCLFSI